MLQNLAHNWLEFSTELIIGGKTPDNIPFLKLFLQDYQKEFHIEVLNAGCKKCIYQYHKDLIKKHTVMENVSNYKLHKKREGLSLEFGGAFLVTNENITDDLAQKLIKRFQEMNSDFKVEDLFEVFPKDEPKKVEESPKEFHTKKRR